MSRLKPLSNNDIRTTAKLARAVYADPCDWQCFSQDGTTWLAIEGSDELIDWRRNLEFLLTSSDTHIGFSNYATLLMSQMLVNNVSVMFSNRLIITGHSLGGAVATIIAANLQDHIQNLHLVTFGSPRPGGKRFAKRLRVPHYRFVHGKDVVPHLPSSILGFRHTATPKPLLVPGDNLLHGVQDHAMDGYCLALPEGN
jgi:pimeloyl-ACP methyl ester carboxylesterase